MPDRITTREAAIEEMLRWANGEGTFRHEMLMLTDAQNMTPSEWALSALADATEAQKWAAVAGALPPAHASRTCAEQAGEAAGEARVTVPRLLLLKCMQAIELEWGETETVLQLRVLLGGRL